MASINKVGTEKSFEAQLPEEIKNNQKILDQHFDPEFAKSLVKNVLDHIDHCYFRSEFIGFDDYPQRNNPDVPLIFASNHSGMAFPWDGIMFSTGLFRLNNYQFKNAFRVLSAPMLSQSQLMNPFLIKNFWRRAGGVDATFLNFETMMHYNKSNLLIYPEGVPGIGKGFDKKYQLQRFSTSFIRMSLKYKTDIIPVATVNGEYINPYTLNSNSLNKLINKIGIPFLPIGIMTILLPFQPWLFYFGFPAKLTYVMGKRIKPHQMIQKPYEEITQEEIWEITEKVKEQMQAELNDAVEKYGRKPYRLTELLKSCATNLKKFPFFIPAFWPSLFMEFDRLYKKKSINIKLNFLSGIKAILKNPIAIAFFFPIIGWIPILLRGFKKVE